MSYSAPLFQTLVCTHVTLPPIVWGAPDSAGPLYHREKDLKKTCWKCSRVFNWWNVSWQSLTQNDVIVGRGWCAGPSLAPADTRYVLKDGLRIEKQRTWCKRCQCVKCFWNCVPNCHRVRAGKVPTLDSLLLYLIVQDQCRMHTNRFSCWHLLNTRWTITRSYQLRDNLHVKSRGKDIIRSSTVENTTCQITWPGHTSSNSAISDPPEWNLRSWLSYAKISEPFVLSYTISET